jgi:hypothetical protein
MRCTPSLQCPFFPGCHPGAKDRTRENEHKEVQEGQFMILCVCVVSVLVCVCLCVCQQTKAARHSYIAISIARVRFTRC